MVVRLCCAPGCEDLAEPGRARCAFHLAESERRGALRKARAKLAPEALAGAALYATPRWKRERRGFLFLAPLCAECARDGVVTPAREVDHVVPHRGDEGLFWDRRNWQSLCRPCHSRKTAREVLTAGRRDRGVSENPTPTP